MIFEKFIWLVMVVIGPFSGAEDDSEAFGLRNYGLQISKVYLHIQYVQSSIISDTFNSIAVGCFPKWPYRMILAAISVVR